MIKESWTVGDILITRLCEAEVAIPGGPGSMLPDATPAALSEMPWLRPHFVTEEYHLVMSIHALLIQSPGVRLIVDTCVGNDKTRNLANFNHLNNNFLNSLNNAGWSRESVTDVLCTHLHVDHVGWNTMLVEGQWVPTFPKAKYHFGREEYEFWLSKMDGGAGNEINPELRYALDDVATFNDSVKPIVDAGLVHLVESTAEIAPGVRLIPTPGHTPGHVSVLLESKNRQAVITGDVFHHPCQIGRPQWAGSFDFSAEAASSMRGKFLELFAGEDVLVIGTHFSSPTAGWIKFNGSGFSFSALHAK